ncbi:MAG: hypothetical protein WCC48_08300 [Anaeromyxobacteraceae bacterium]
MRLSPAQVWSDRSVDAPLLIDRDGTTKVQVVGTTHVFVRFAKPLVHPKVKVLGAKALRVSATGMGASSPPDEAGWVTAELRGEIGSLVALELEPEGPDAEVAEIEVWGQGEARGTLDPAALAAATRQEERPRSPPIATALARELWLGDAVVAIPASAGAATLVPRGTAEGADCMSATFAPGALALGARRAYLAYEANLHRAVELRRSIGGAAPVGGLWLGTAASATLVDELDPAKLTGNDPVLLCLPNEATSQVTVQGLRLVLVLDRGANGFDRDAELAMPAALDGDAATVWEPAPARMELGLDRLGALEQASIRTAGAARLHSVGTFDGMAWSEQGAVDLADGTTALELGGRLARGVELTFDGAGGTPSAKVAELSLVGSGIGPRVAANQLVISYPRLSVQSGKLVGERFGGQAYVAGWAESPAGRGAVEVDGAPVDVAAGGALLRVHVHEGDRDRAARLRGRAGSAREVAPVLRGVRRLRERDDLPRLGGRRGSGRRRLGQGAVRPGDHRDGVR